MQVEQIYTRCLAQGAYYITSNGEAAIIDPLRETAPYIERLQRDGVQLKYIFETHFHADFVSGHIDLSKMTGAQIVYGPTAQPAFQAIIGVDNQEFKIGNTSIKLLHTPGHTMESSCFLLQDETGKEVALFSDDTLFLGDVGRPDLAQKAGEITEKDLAGYLYESLQSKIMPLENDIIVYPAHGAGSACGKNMMKETVDTLGNQKRMNYALNQPSKEAFIDAVLDGLTAPPAYFGMNVAMNKNGYETFDSVLAKGLVPLSVSEFEAVAESTGALILDTRLAADFAKGFVPQSISIGVKGDFAPWAGAMIGDVKQNILLVTEPGMEEETVTRLARVGFDNVLGYLKGGYQTWVDAGKESDKINRISTAQFAADFKEKECKVLDVRKETEYAAEHIDEAFSRPLSHINDWIKDINPQESFYLHCQGGYRSMIAASILQARGYRNFAEVDGGFAAIAETAVPKSNFVCQSKVDL